ncbi:membrane-associated Zn-dependent protease 1 [Pseudomonas fluorescens]|uniref:membrane-associated Zn-dependent protease 1 n=1 Tax=Pseudomonas fluorescens TaxID=294 RepID=UPI0011AF7E89|nr:membrane-associated Zn-dependent protease 1 [Pseudomonas fluorescens]
MKNRWLGAAAVIIVSTCFVGNSSAAPELEVKFHMGLGNGTTQEVGGTLANTGDAPIAQGYLVITPVATQCHPQASVLYQFGLLAPGEEQEFRVPVTERFSSYRLQMGAFDGQGFAVAAKDANQLVLDERISEERENCNSAREVSSK